MSGHRQNHKLTSVTRGGVLVVVVVAMTVAVVVVVIEVAAEPARLPGTQYVC